MLKTTSIGEAEASLSVSDGGPVLKTSLLIWATGRPAARWTAKTQIKITHHQTAGGLPPPSSRLIGEADVGEVQISSALQQWKRDAAFRKLIRPPAGYTLLEYDFAGQEFRWMAVVSGDETMLSLCAPGEDAHAYMGASIRSLDYREFQSALKAGDKSAKAARQLGKVANLSLSYKTGAKRLQSVAWVQHGLRLSDAESQAIHRTYQTTYPKVPLYWQRQQHLARSQNYIENLLGRRVQFVPTGERSPEFEWSYGLTAINYPIQSMGAEQKLLAMFVLRQELPRFNGRFYFELHDAVFLIVPDEVAEEASHYYKQVLSNLPYKKAWRLDLPVAFPVDGKMGRTWGDLKEF
jgi:DNA polymerase I-like protein with 3'-5' exonuclease and polymerase domains